MRLYDDFDERHSIFERAGITDEFIVETECLLQTGEFFEGGRT